MIEFTKFTVSEKIGFTEKHLVRNIHDDGITLLSVSATRSAKEEFDDRALCEA